MIAAKISDGLGNQMFQYATARSLAVRHGVEVLLDLSQYTNTKKTKRSHLAYASKEGSWRSFQLNNFNISAKLIRPTEIIRLFFASDTSIIRRSIKGESIINEVLGTSAEAFSYIYRSRSLVESFCCWLKNRNHIMRLSRRFLGESHYHFDPSILSAPNNVYLKGYWESEKYFLDIRDLICREFVLKQPLANRNLEYKKKLESVESVGVHIRRGDNLRPYALKKWGLIPIDYYKKSIGIISAKVSVPHVFVFSDDIGWCMENIQLGVPTTFIEGNDENTAFTDIELMRLCKHNIIANSSFGWWGAWLNRNKDKIVCAPAKWFNEFDVDTKDLIPESWIRVSNT